MEEIQTQQVVSEPSSDNSEITVQENEGQAQPAPSELLLGKFKSVDDLSQAYEKLERHQGLQSKELGELRKTSAFVNAIQGMWSQMEQLNNDRNFLSEVSQKYNTPEYFQNPAFKEIFTAAYQTLGQNLDTDRFINLLEGYVESRIYNHERSRAAKDETDRIISSMSFAKNNSNSITPPKKRLDEMTPNEIDEMLERVI